MGFTIRLFIGKIVFAVSDLNYLVEVLGIVLRYLLFLVQAIFWHSQSVFPSQFLPKHYP